MFLKKLVSSYSLLLSLGAFYLGSIMLSGEGVFADFPPEWIGVMPFNSWNSLALFGMIVFGLGNAAAAVYGFTKKNNRIFLLAIVLGALCFAGALMPAVLLGEWYLSTVYLFMAGALQILLSIIGLFFVKSRKGGSALTSQR
ncbi:hypothetical protein [Planococcus sp. CAU13]|uniref:hypothetical protein n=1 Tax=Planococcus sp. CAU13 TaxID=1541197 RepID=UPI00052FF55D|nr:hypothetical protein [Planococcus sp. CAU13]